MIGIILFVVAVFALQYKKYIIALLIMLSFVSSGFRLLPDSLIGLKNEDLAIVLFFFWALLCKNKKEKYENIDQTYSYKFVMYFVVFLIALAVFSIIHYDFTLYQVIQGGRPYFVILLFFILLKIDVRYIRYIITRPALYITLLVSILYIIQVATKLPLLPAPANDEVSIDSTTGVARFYNAPVYLKFYLYGLCLAPRLFNIKRKNIAIAIFLFALLCTQGRTNIGTTVAILFLGLLMQNKFGRIMKYSLIGCIIVLPFLDVITSRLEGNNTDGDVEAVLNGSFVKLAKERGTPSGTMEYRFAWVYERASYLVERPFTEQIFGLGMISDSQPVVYRKYNFFYGLTNEDFGRPYQLATPDVSLGEMIAKYGFGGTLILYCVWFSLLLYFYKHKKKSLSAFVGFFFILSMIVGSISNNSLACTSNLVFPFMIFLMAYSDMSLIKNTEENNNQ